MELSELGLSGSKRVRVGPYYLEPHLTMREYRVRLKERKGEPTQYLPERRHVAACVEPHPYERLPRLVCSYFRSGLQLLPI